MSTRRIALIVLVALLVVGCVVLLRPRMTVADVDELVGARIEAGSRAERVGAVLDSLGIEHSGYKPGDREMRAIWRRTRVGIVSESSIQAVFLFDPEGRLTRYELEEVITAL